ncbi:MAG: ATP-binding cassette domain-containing protein, partial [Bacillota bacterium]|nr:ATP-binding cassette domain-containing protein [Bacillota bacterium]
EIYFEGKLLQEVDNRTQSSRIGFVQQNPDNQIVTDKVWHELAFGMESLGYDTPTIRRRVAEMASFFGISDWFYKNVSELSGGQKQLLNLAAIMTMQPSVLVLDEPTSQLDPIAASDFLSMLGKINRELGTTIILTEHRLDEAFTYSTKVAVMEKGTLIAVGTAKEVGLKLKDLGNAMFLAMPIATRIWASVNTALDCPVTVREGRDFLDELSKTVTFSDVPKKEEHTYDNKVLIEAKEIWFKYDKNLPDVIKGLDIKLHKGEYISILGGNGAGKSTTLKVLSGIKKAYRGNVSVNGSLALLAQNPQALFVKKTVREDLFEVFADKKIEKEEVEKRILNVVELCRLNTLLDRHPFDISGGEQQRAALAKVLLLQPEILLLDEPTKGLDAEFKEVFADILEKLLASGIGIIMVSHDVEFCAKYAHKCALFFDGNIINIAEPQKFFAGNSFYTTSANRISRGYMEGAVTPEDVMKAIGGTLPARIKSDIDYDRDTSDNDAILKAKEIKTLEKKKLDARTKAACVFSAVLAPITLLIGQFVLSNKHYNLIAILILVECMIPFFLIFENRKPQSKELVVIAVLCALGIAGRAVLYMLPQFKPVMAIAIIAGVAFGGETGFLVGSMSMLVSNIMFSQGPWTPWQMFSMGIIGFISGILTQKGIMGRDKLTLTVFGVFSAIIMYGGLMNTASALMMSTQAFNLKMLIPYFVSGFPMDLVHAVATAVFLWFGSAPMLEKLDRIKVKYGIIGV